MLSLCSPVQEDKCLRWISCTVMSLIVVRIFQAHSDCRSCGLCHHLGSLPGCTLRDSVLIAWTPVLALQRMDCWITSYCVKRHYQDTEAVLTKLFIFYHTFLFFIHQSFISDFNETSSFKSRLTISAYRWSKPMVETALKHFSFYSVCKCDIKK